MKSTRRLPAPGGPAQVQTTRKSNDQLSIIRVNDQTRSPVTAQTLTDQDQPLALGSILLPDGLLGSTQSVPSGLDDVLLDLLAGGLFEMSDLLVELEFSHVQRTETKLCETFLRCACVRSVDAVIHLGDQRFEIIDLGGRG